MTDYKIKKAIRNGCEYSVGGECGGGGMSVEMLMVAGGGAGCEYYGAGGGAGGLRYYENYNIGDYNEINIGLLGFFSNGGDTYFNGNMVCGGGQGASYGGKGKDGGSGGGGGGATTGSYCCRGCGISLQGNDGGYGNSSSSGGHAGGGGAGSIGNDGCSSSCSGGAGGKGIQLNIEGTKKYYSGGGGGSGPTGGGGGGCTGGTGGCCYGCSSNCAFGYWCGDGHNATGCGGGGGGGQHPYQKPGAGGNGLVVVRYPTGKGYDLLGGCKYTCGLYTIHCFRDSGFLIKNQKKKVKYIAVGGGGGGGGCCYSNGGGGGGEVSLGYLPADIPLNIKIGAGGAGGASAGGNGGSTYINGVEFKGGQGGKSRGYCGCKKAGVSGGGYLGGCEGNLGGGGGAGGIGSYDDYVGGIGICGYGGGGGGSYSSASCTGGQGCDGGGDGAKGCQCGCDATNYGGGGGAGYYYKGGKGCQGMVEICYPIDGSWGITSATGGNCCYTCDGYCVHRFTSDGTFCAGPVTVGPGIWHNPTQCLITMSYDGINWFTISDRNLGATTSCVSNTGSYGCKYQWGNNYGMDGTTTGAISGRTTTRVDASNYGPGNYYSRNCFIYNCCAGCTCDWSTVQNDNLWGGTTGTNAAMQGPTPSGFHVPSEEDFEHLQSVYSSLTGGRLTAEKARQYLCIPNAGCRSALYCGCLCCNGSTFALWTSNGSTDSNGCPVAGYYSNDNASDISYSSRAYGYPIRAFKNEGVAPDETWTPLFIKK